MNLPKNVQAIRWFATRAMAARSTQGRGRGELVPDSIRRQGPQGRKLKHSKGLTRHGIGHSPAAVMAPADYAHDAAQPANRKETPG